MADDPGGPVPRTPREEVRRRLLSAAVRAFAEHGYADSRLEDIAHAAGFTKGAVYSNFGGKRDLFGAVLRERSDAEIDTLLARIGESADPAEAVADTVRGVARRITEDPERGRLGLEFAARATRDAQTRDVVGRMRRAQREAVAEAVSRFAARGVPLGADPGLTALILHCLTNGLSMEHLADPGSVDTETIERALGAVIAALAPVPPPDREEPQ
ncbi:TetR/AcrR family transcriptional regulator [Nocardiopsis tropica]|uniref:TetR family transcriptional regulator n=1 Tax=Nocardiopsis tropica TaxID=109330 RepID=A0ABU7KWM9_9ACTN|nr:TetR family transcriptional regulator [Nocardiopsis umidischolae]MEE2053713.1 TetR family transcriptional regulator [Nocardiopsis umidischolae]